MNQFPSYVQILASNYSEEYLDNRIRSEFDRGPAKQRSLVTRGMKRVTFNALVCDDKYQNFLSFYRDDLDSGTNWFEFLDPSKNPAEKKKARIVSQNLSASPTGEDFPYWTFQLTLEMYD